jgi:hypothetical protein
LRGHDRTLGAEQGRLGQRNSEAWVSARQVLVADGAKGRVPKRRSRSAIISARYGTFNRKPRFTEFDLAIILRARYNNETNKDQKKQRNKNHPCSTATAHNQVNHACVLGRRSSAEYCRTLPTADKRGGFKTRREGRAAFAIIEYRRLITFIAVPPLLVTSEPYIALPSQSPSDFLCIINPKQSIVQPEPIPGSY